METNWPQSKLLKFLNFRGSTEKSEESMRPFGKVEITYGNPFLGFCEGMTNQVRFSFQCEQIFHQQLFSFHRDRNRGRQSCKCGQKSNCSCRMYVGFSCGRSWGQCSLSEREKQWEKYESKKLMIVSNFVRREICMDEF